MTFDELILLPPDEIDCHRWNHRIFAWSGLKRIAGVDEWYDRFRMVVCFYQPYR
jgi:hypothetical protein